MRGSPGRGAQALLARTLLTKLESVGMRARRATTLAASVAIAALMLLAPSAVNAAALPRIRFLNAVPGTATARVEVVSTMTGTRTAAGGESAFGEFTSLLDFCRKVDRRLVSRHLPRR